MTLADVERIFAGEVAAARGQVTQALRDERRLFLRAVLPRTVEVAPGDTLQAGVALRLTRGDAQVCPYVFRLVCTNGAIWAHTVASRRVADVFHRTGTEARNDLMGALLAATDAEAFAHAADEMRTIRSRPAPEMDTLLSLLSLAPDTEMLLALMETIMAFEDGDDLSAYGFLNAVTATARDTHDPDLRWRLEELGGGIPASVLASHPVRNGAAAEDFPDFPWAYGTGERDVAQHRVEAELRDLALVSSAGSVFAVAELSAP